MSARNVRQRWGYSAGNYLSHYQPSPEGLGLMVATTRIKRATPAEIANEAKRKAALSSPPIPPMVPMLQLASPEQLQMQHGGAAAEEDWLDFHPDHFRRFHARRTQRSAGARSAAAPAQNHPPEWQPPSSPTGEGQRDDFWDDADDGRGEGADESEQALEPPIGEEAPAPVEAEATAAAAAAAAAPQSGTMRGKMSAVTRKKLVCVCAFSRLVFAVHLLTSSIASLFLFSSLDAVSGAVACLQPPWQRCASSLATVCTKRGSSRTAPRAAAQTASQAL